MPALPSEATTLPSVRTLQDAAALGVLVLVGELTRLLALPVHRVLQISPAGLAGRRWRSRCWPPQTPRLPSRAAASPAGRKQVRFLAAGFLEVSWQVFGSLAWWDGASCRVIDAQGSSWAKDVHRPRRAGTLRTLCTGPMARPAALHCAFVAVYCALTAVAPLLVATYASYAALHWPT